MPDELKTVSGFFRTEFTEKKSVFIGYTDSVKSAEEAEAFVARIKKQENAARHNVWAYLLENGTMRYSDDGEPQGTGGLPVLEVLKKSGVKNTVLVVTRYFGGILLGAPGLVRAYSKAASMAVEGAGISTYIPFCDCKVVCDYGEYDKLIYEIKRYDVILQETEYAESVVIRFSVSGQDYKELCERIRSVSNAKTNVLTLGSHYDISSQKNNKK